MSSLDPRILKNGQIVSIATLNNLGFGAGFMYTGPDAHLYVNPSKPAQFNQTYLFQIEKPPQKSGGNPDLNIVYDGDDILLKSLANGKYARYITNYGGSNVWYINADEHGAKYDYRDQGNGTMEALRISLMGNGSERGRPVMMDGIRSYSIHNPKSVAYFSYTSDGLVKSAGNANERESWFFTDENGQVPQ